MKFHEISVVKSLEITQPEMKVDRLIREDPERPRASDCRSKPCQKPSVPRSTKLPNTGGPFRGTTGNSANFKLGV